ncbi:unnamed protein product, partial [Gulo gulo]
LGRGQGWGSQRQGQGQGVHRQAGPPDQGHDNQVPGRRSVSSPSPSRALRSLASSWRPSLKDEVLKVMPVHKQTRAVQQTMFKAFIVMGDYNQHTGLDVKCSKEVATAICGAILLAKLSIVPVGQSYWWSKIGKPCTVPCKADWPLWLCAGAPPPCSQRRCPRSC